MTSAHPEPGEGRILPNFLMEGDRERGTPIANPHSRMRAMMGMPPRAPAPPLVQSLSQDEGTAAREWLRHVEAGRIGG